MKSLYTFLAMLLLFCASARAQILADIGTFSGGDPGIADFVAAGVTEVTGFTLATSGNGWTGDIQRASFLGNTNPRTSLNTQFSLTLTYYDIAGTVVTNPSGVFNGAEFSDGLIRDYMALFSPTTGRQVSVTGLASYLAPSTEYFAYIFGAGDANNQNSTFTLQSTVGTIAVGSGTTSATIDGSGVGDNHFVKLRFTTPSDMTGYDFRFNWTQGTAGNTTALNGFAIVAVPEPSTALLGGLSALLLLARRRRS